MNKKASQEEIDARFTEYHATVNMSASELERWSDTECSKLASVDRSPIRRNLKLLRTKKEDWGDSEYKSAGRTISFVSRMRGNERGEPAKEGCPSKRDISLKNWAYDPNKKSMNNMKNESTEVAALPTIDSIEQGGESPLDSLYEYKQPKQIKSFPFWVKGIGDVDEDSMVTIKGYGAVFGNVDLGNDVILRNAFAKTLNDKGNKVYFLADHKYNLDNFLGIAEVQEDNVGLFGEYKMDLRREVAKDAYLAAKQAQEAGLPMGMSIGFDIIDQEIDQKSQVRMLKEIRLHEISLTMFPMNEQARVVEAKSVKELVELSTKDSLLNEGSQTSTQVDEAEIKSIENLIQSIQNERKKYTS